MKLAGLCCIVVVLTNTFVHGSTSVRKLPTRTLSTTSSVKPTNTYVGIATSNENKSADLSRMSSVSNSLFVTKPSSKAISSHVPSVIKGTQSSATREASITTRIMPSNSIGQTFQVHGSTSITQNKYSSTENMIKATDSMMSATETMHYIITTASASQPLLNVESTVSTVTSVQSSASESNPARSSNATPPVMISSTNVSPEKSSVLEETSSTIMASKSEPYSSTMGSTGKPSVIVQPTASSGVMNRINSSQTGSPSTTLAIPQSSTISSLLNATQTTVNVMNTQTVVARRYTSNVTKPPVMIPSTMSPEITFVHTMIVNNTTESLVLEMTSSMVMTTSLLTIPDKTTPPGMLYSSISLMVNTVNATTALSSALTKATHSVAPDTTTFPGMISSILSPTMNMTSSSRTRISTTASTILTNGTMSVVPSMTSLPAMVNSTTLIMSNATRIPVAPTMDISISPTPNVTTPPVMVKSTMVPTLNETKSSLPANITTTATMVKYSSQSVLPNMTTPPVVVRGTASPVIGSSKNITLTSSMGIFTSSIVETVNIPNSTMQPTLNATKSSVITKATMAMSISISPTSNLTKPSIAVDATTSQMINITSYVIVTESLMTSTMGKMATSSFIINATTSATPDVMVSNTMSRSSAIENTTSSKSTVVINPATSTVPGPSLVTVNATIKSSTVLVNPRMSIVPNITMSSRRVNATRPPVVTTLSISRNALSSDFVLSTINTSETLSSSFVQSDTVSSSFVQSETVSSFMRSGTVSRELANYTTLPVKSVSGTPTMSLHATQSSIFATMLSSTVIQSRGMTNSLTTVIPRVRTSPVANMSNSVKTLVASSVLYTSSSPVMSSSTSIPPVVLVRLTIITESCTQSLTQSNDFKDAIRKSCSHVLSIPVASIIVTGVTCGSIIVDVSIKNENAVMVVKKLNEAVEKKQLNVTYNGTQLAVSSVKHVTPTSSDDDDDNTALIIYIVFGAVLGLAFIIGIVALIVRCRHERSTGMFHLPSEEHLELSGFSGPNKASHQAGNFYGELQPETDEPRVGGKFDTNDSAAGNTENVGGDIGGGGGYLPAWKNLPTMDMSEAGREDENAEEVNDNLLLTYGKRSDEEEKFADERKESVASYDNVGVV